MVVGTIPRMHSYGDPLHHSKSVVQKFSSYSVVRICWECRKSAGKLLTGAASDLDHFLFVVVVVIVVLDPHADN